MKFHGPNRVELLCGGEAFFPALIAAIDAAEREVYLESYIYHDDDTGRRVTETLAAASRRGVAVHVTVDGFGSANLAPALREVFDAAGVEYVVFRPETPWWQSGLKFLSRERLRRMHRKLALVDRAVAFCGGINILDDLHDPNHGPLEAPRFDFAVRVEGPLVGPIGETMVRQWLRLDWRRIASKRGELERALESWLKRREWAKPHPEGRVRAGLVTRDNLRNRRAIERAYIAAIRLAQRELIICNAYYFPGTRFRKRLIRAAKRGVRVRLLLQGRPEYPIQHYASQMLYAELLSAGIEIHEYTHSFLHAKVGVVDGIWATVGSSNIDPFSLLLAREANVVFRDEALAGKLRDLLEDAFEHEATAIHPEVVFRRSRWARIKNAFAYGALRVGVYITGRASQY